jgi:clan AA aspartic protease (TIGR02281 family)
MAGYQPSEEDRAILPRRREPANWPLLLVIAVIALGGLLWIVKPGLFMPSSSEVSAGAGERPDSRFADLYKRYAMTPLGASVAASHDVEQALAILQKEPCNRQTAYKASTGLQEVHATRAAAEMLRGFSTACADGNNELYQASELFLVLGDLDTAIRTSSDVIRRQPDGQNAYFVRARAEQGLGQYTAAIEDYVTLLQVLPKLRSVRSEVFTRMSDTYEKLDRPCEAIVPIQIYMALNPEQRTLLPLEHRITELAAKGKCAAHYATGTARIVRLSAGVPIAKAEINGISGTFLVDTGASFVTLSRSFAARAKPAVIKTDQVELQTANGRSSATLATIDVVKLLGVEAAGVPAIVTDKEFGAGVDGLLGMSFLSRFTVVMEDGQMKLTAKALKTEP